MFELRRPASTGLALRPGSRTLTTGTTVYWSPDYSLNARGDVSYASESSASYALACRSSGIFSSDHQRRLRLRLRRSAEDGFSVNGTTEDDYKYWNAGVSLGVEKFTFDFHYWDTDIDVANSQRHASAFPLERRCGDERFSCSPPRVTPALRQRQKSSQEISNQGPRTALVFCLRQFST